MRICGLLVLLLVAGATVSWASEDRPLVGLVERVRIFPDDVVIRAKLDTGADNSSLHAPRVVQFIKDGEKWVRFEVHDENGQSTTIERPLVRVAKIKKPGAKRQKRLVVMLGLCVGNIYREAQVSLADRSHFKYQFVVGRSFMHDALLIDPSKKYTVEPECRSVPQQ